MKISIINPGGITNFGERAILVGTIFDLVEKYNSPTIAVFGYDDVSEFDPPLAKMFKKYNVKTYPNLFVQGSKVDKVKDVIRKFVAPKSSFSNDSYEFLKSSDLICAKGQESLTGSYGIVHFFDSILEPFVVSRINKNVVLYGHSIGPVKGPFQTFISQLFLKKIQKVYARDHGSIEQLRKLGYPSSQTEQVKDLAYKAVEKLPISTMSSKKAHYLIIPNAAIIKNDNDKASYHERLDWIIKELLKRKETILIGSSVTASDWNNDYTICNEFASRYPSLILQKYKTLDDLLLDIKNSKMVISSRLHPIILSTGLGVEVLALSNAPKVRNLLHDFNGQDSHDPLRASKANLIKAI